MRCANCGSDNPEGMKFCEECGTKLVRACPSCGREVRPTAKFCGECGTPLTAEVPSPRSQAPSLEESGGQKSREARARGPESRQDVAERRQLTVMFCDLVGSTPLAEQLDPEELREVVRAYQDTCTAVIHRFDGYIARYVGDALLVYFGYPQAHEDDAQRAVRAGLGIVAALPALNQQLHLVVRARQAPPLQVRIGIHTGLVVVGELGGKDYREAMALGDTPNLAARLQGIAAPDTVVISAATQRLIAGLFTCQGLGRQELKGVSTPVAAYRVLGESGAQSRFEAAVTAGLTPLVGREHEVGLLTERWEQAKQGTGQVVLLSGEAGIGKSRLVQRLKEQVTAEGATRIEFRCSPYHQNSAFYPIIEHLQRLLQFVPHEAPQARVAKLTQVLARYRFPQADTLPLLAAVLSLPQPDGAPPVTLSPQKQKQKTQEVLVAWIVEEAEQAVVYCAWEDLHWIDPSSLDVLTLVLDQVPTTRLLALLTFRSDFTPPWRPHSHITQLTLTRLGRPQVAAMVQQVTGGKAFPAEVLQQIITKTDGVPLFVEELTKMVLESGLLREEDGRYVRAHGGAPLPLGIPATLHDALMARLDRLAPVREIAQMGATLGREFSYEVLHAVLPLEETALQQGLRQLVEAELLYQRGLPPQATYLFKHALIQDAAYQSLLKSKRQQYHKQIGQVLEEKSSETKETQPELLAHHYTEAGLIAQALPYWQRAGERATQRSAYVEAINHLTKGLEMFKSLPDAAERPQQELVLQVALGVPLIAVRGYAAPEVEQTYTRARELSQQIGDTSQLVLVLFGLWAFYLNKLELQAALELSEQLLTLAQQSQDKSLLLEAHQSMGHSLFELGEFTQARRHLEQGIDLYDAKQHRAHVFRYGGADRGVACLSLLALSLWYLGYPEQALKRSQEAVALAEGLSHPLSLAYALAVTALCHQLRREGPLARERAEAVMTLATEQGFPYFSSYGTRVRGWALAEQGQGEEGITQMRQGLAAFRATGAEMRTYFLAPLAEACANVGQAEEGLSVLAEALATGNKTGERIYEAELYRLKGELTLQQSITQRLESSVPSTQRSAPSTPAEAEAEACFLKAIEIARRQQAKSLELRAVMSLSRLWQHQGKKDEAHRMLAEIYGWFTEGFDTKDLQEAKALLQELA
jgi:class 3 adenylate cyclase